MNWRIKLLEIHLPAPVKNKVLTELFRITAEAFEEEVNYHKGFTYKKRLIIFADYSNKLASQALKKDVNLTKIKNKLYNNSYDIGFYLRKYLNIRTMKEAMKVAEIFYRIIGIDFKGNKKGEIIINNCLFSDYYDKEVCSIISALDSGIAAGLTGGGKLKFNHRITEGSSCCEALIKIEDG